MTSVPLEILQQNLSYFIHVDVGFTSNLPWSLHILSILKDVFCLTYYLKRLHVFGPYSILLQFVYSHLLPFILFCSPLSFPEYLREISLDDI